MKEHKYDSYNFTHCINPGCYKKLSGDFDCYVINREEIKKGELKRYKCPYCNAEWTVDDQQVNSIEVNNFEDGDDFILIIDNDKIEDNEKIIGRYSAKSVVDVFNKKYIHIPSTKLKNPNVRMFNLNSKLSDNEIIFNLRLQGFIK